MILTIFYTNRANENLHFHPLFYICQHLCDNTNKKASIIPIGSMTTIFQMVAPFNQAGSLDMLLPSLAIAVIPLLYSIGIFVIALLVEIKLSKEA